MLQKDSRHTNCYHAYRAHTSRQASAKMGMTLRAYRVDCPGSMNMGYPREEVFLLSRCNDVALESQCLRNKAASAKQKTADWIGSNEPRDQHKCPEVLRKEFRAEHSELNGHSTVRIGADPYIPNGELDIWPLRLGLDVRSGVRDVALPRLPTPPHEEGPGEVPRECFSFSST